MKRLWVRLSLMISSVLFLMFFLQFLVITLEQTGLKPDLDGPPPHHPLKFNGGCLNSWLFPLWLAQPAE